jgi:arylsulfatase A-like enzyme
MFWSLVQIRLHLADDIPARKRADDVNRQVVEWLERSGDAPFFIFINYFDLHLPYLPPQQYRTRFSKTADGRFDEWMSNSDSAPTTDDLKAAYDGAISWTDRQLGNLLHTLRQRELANDLLVVVTSDHGEAFGEHAMRYHGNSLYREEIHVPLVIWNPLRVPGGLRSSKPVSNAWVGATVLDLIKWETGDSTTRFPGLSLREAWEAASLPDSLAPISELEQLPWLDPELPVQRGSMLSLVTKEWHLILHSSEGVQLFDWKHDPGEVNNVAADVSNADAVAHLDSILGVRYP